MEEYPTSRTGGRGEGSRDQFDRPVKRARYDWTAAEETEYMYIYFLKLSNKENGRRVLHSKRGNADFCEEFCTSVVLTVALCGFYGSCGLWGIPWKRLHIAVVPYGSFF